MKNSPAPTEIRELRKKHGLTQAAAAKLLYSSARAWREWEAGTKPMRPAYWELFTIKVTGSIDKSGAARLL